MAFISALWDGTYHENRFIRDNAHIVIIMIGYDSVIPIQYHLMVELYPTQQGTEYAFAIVEHERDKGFRRPIFDSKVSNAIIPKSYRPQIKKVLFDTTEKLVRGCNFPSFFMTTFCTNLPPEALEKYADLCQIFRRCGYEVVQTEPVPGKHFWFMNQHTP